MVKMLVDPLRATVSSQRGVCVWVSTSVVDLVPFLKRMNWINCDFFFLNKQKGDNFYDMLGPQYLGICCLLRLILKRSKCFSRV